MAISAANLVEEPKRTDKSGYTKNWLAWVMVLIFSLVSMHFLPFFKYLTGNYSAVNWYNDIFGNIGMITISASMMISAGFEIAAKRGRYALPVWIILVLAMIYYLIFSAFVFTNEVVDEINRGEFLRKCARVNLICFCIMLLSGFLCFSPLPGIIKNKIRSAK